jgi:predicted PurR-regulated permease PerM
MSAGDWAAVVLSIVAAIAVVGLLFALSALVRTLATLRTTVDELRQQTIPLVDDMHTTVRQANNDLVRVDALLESAESISSTVDSASRLAYLAFSNPVIKALAFAGGTGRAIRRVRRNRESR